MRILLNKVCSSSHSPLSALDNNNVTLLPAEGRHLSLGDREGAVGRRGEEEQGPGGGNSGRGWICHHLFQEEKGSQHALLAPTVLLLGGGGVVCFCC